jgi:mRNA interferase YafQ
MFILKVTRQFDKDVALLKKPSAKNELLIKSFLKLLQVDGVKGIPAKNKPHKLKGNYVENWEAHIKPDRLIIWFEITEEKEIILLRLGSHSDLF